jgi:hypothetical protein
MTIEVAGATYTLGQEAPLTVPTRQPEQLPTGGEGEAR